MRLAPIAAVTALLAATPEVYAASLPGRDVQFLKDDATGADYELAISTAAARSASDHAIRRYAAMVVSDHAKADAALRHLAASKGVDLPSSMSVAHQVELVKLKLLTGHAFDTAYVDDMVAVNADDRSTAAKEVAATDDPDIKAFLQTFGSMDRKHERMAKSLQSKQ